MSFGFILIPEEQTVIYTQPFKVSLNDSPIPNRRTKFDRTNLICLRGDDEHYSFQCYLGKNKPDLSANDIIATGRVTESTDTQLFSIDVIDGELGSNFQTGLFVISISKEITIDLPILLKYDVKAVNKVTGKIFTLVSGQIEVRTEYLTNLNTTP